MPHGRYVLCFSPLPTRVKLTAVYLNKEGLTFDGLDINWYQYAKKKEEENRRDLVDIVDRVVPLPQACSNESSTSKHMIHILNPRTLGLHQSTKRPHPSMSLSCSHESSATSSIWMIGCL